MKQMNNRSSVISAIHIALITVITSTPVFLIGASNNLIRQDINISTSEIGIILTLYWLGSLLGAFMSRKATIFSSINKQISFSIFITAVSLSLIFFHPKIGLWIGGILGGTAYGYSQPYTNYLIMRTCDQKIQGFAFGLKQAAIPTATLLCSLAVPILAVPFGWRSLFGMITCVAFIYGGLTLIFSRNIHFTKKANSNPIPPLSPNIHLIMLGVVGGLGAMIGNSLGGFLIASLTFGGISLVTASLIAAFASITNIVVRISAGIITDHSNYSPSKLLIFMFMVGVLGTLFLTTSSYFLLLIGSILAFGGGWGWAGLLHYITSIAYPEYEGQATAFSQMGVSFGAALGPLLFGILFSTVGPSTAWAIMSLAGAIAIIIMLISQKFIPDNKNPKNLTQKLPS
ncbi:MULTISPECIES: MFS transporter [unclassified Bacillus cereus group]|uniref:MFS transporter n=1 Tax=unclassified Bacillus cereus group TaxID=2750818 RepID=UPI001F5999D8|nr:MULTISPECIES: MFS transporter [unclassified Bacillus cereus group]